MDYNNFYANYHGTGEPYCFTCPMAQNPYNCYQPMYRIVGDTEQPYFNYEADHGTGDEGSAPEAEDRAPRDVDRVVAAIRRDAGTDIRELERIGIKPPLLNYLITSMVSYIDRNYNKYKGPFEQRMREAEQDLRRDLHWAFDIFRVLGASPATAARLTEIVVRTSLRNLRPAPPTLPGPPSPPPMPRY